MERRVEEQYPSVGLGYELTLHSYDWTLDRIRAVDERIQSIQTYAATVGFAASVTIAAVAPSPDYVTFWFGLGIVAFVAITIVGVLARGQGMVILPSPAKVYESWLHYSEFEFSSSGIKRAGEHWRENLTLINRKGYMADALGVVFVLEITAFLVWALSQL